MFATRLSRFLLALGATIGIAAVAVTAAEVRINLPDWLIRVAMIKLAFIASLGLLGAGAVLGRHARRQALHSPGETLPLAGGTPEFEVQRRSQDIEARRGDSGR